MAEPDVHFRIDLPEGMEAGLYANVLSVWNSPYDFTLDFGVTDRPEMMKDGNVQVAVRVVTRIRIPISMAQSVLRALADQMEKYEQGHGPIQQPGDSQPTYPPEDLK